MCGAQALGEERERVALQARRGAGDIQASAGGREVAHNGTLECRGAARAVLAARDDAEQISGGADDSCCAAGVVDARGD